MSVSFPPDHPIWQYPKGSRAPQVQNWVELGRRIETILQSLEKRVLNLEQLLSDKQQQLDRIEALLNSINGHLTRKDVDTNGDDRQQSPKPRNRPRAAQFLKAFDD
ncbi:MAG: hypothetical protein H0Z39_10070 [Peptococcaceae bacterium]|nr:hypothetical protein [Peptococcaceae bacterium]